MINTHGQPRMDTEMPSVDDFAAFIAEGLALDGPYGLAIDAPDDTQGDHLWLAGPQDREGHEGFVYQHSIEGALNALSQQLGYTGKDLTMYEDVKESGLHRLAGKAGSVVLWAPSSSPLWQVRLDQRNKTYTGLTLSEALSAALFSLENS